MASDINCNKCLKWDVSDTSQKLTHFPPPEFYPSDTGDTSKGKIKTHIVVFDDLKQCCCLTHEKIESGCWSNKNAEAYLAVHGINAELRVAIIERAINCNKIEKEILSGNPGDNTFQVHQRLHSDL